MSCPSPVASPIESYQRWSTRVSCCTMSSRDQPECLIKTRSILRLTLSAAEEHHSSHTSAPVNTGVGTGVGGAGVASHIPGTTAHNVTHPGSGTGDSSYHLNLHASHGHSHNNIFVSLLFSDAVDTHQSADSHNQMAECNPSIDPSTPQSRVILVTSWVCLRLWHWHWNWCG